MPVQMNDLTDQVGLYQDEQRANLSSEGKVPVHPINLTQLATYYIEVRYHTYLYNPLPSTQVTRDGYGIRGWLFPGRLVHPPIVYTKLD